MVEVDFGGDDGTITCEGCGVELPVFLDECPYCNSDEEVEAEAVEAPCPECGAAIYDDSVRCAICGAYVTMRVGDKSGAKSGLRLVVVVLLIISFLYLMWR